MTDAPFERLWPLAVVPSQDLVGRQAVIDRMYAELSTGRSVILAAARRLGKTSVAKEVVRRLQLAGWIGVHIDFLRFTSQLEVADELASQVIEQSHSLAGRLAQLAAIGRQVAGIVKPHWELAGTEFGIDFSNKREERKVLMRALELPQEMAQRERRPVVMFLDEFQEAAASLGTRIYGIMRSYFQQQPDVHQIFAGSRARLLRQLFTKPNAPLLRYAAEVRLPPIPAQAWVPYVVAKFESVNLSCAPAIAETIVERTGGHPADTMEVCQQLYLLALAAHQRQLDAQLLRAATDEAELRLRSVFDEVWAELSTPAYSRVVATRVARGEPPTAAAARPGVAEGTSPKLLVAALKALVDRGLIERAANGSYQFTEPFFRRYILYRDA